MPFTPKNWQNLPDHSTPITAEALEELESRLAGYTDSQVAPIGGTAPSQTADTFENYKIILLASGNQVKAIPATVLPPTLPGTPTATVKLSAVKLLWAPSTGASVQYAIIKNGSQIAIANQTSYLDLGITTGLTYQYKIQAIDAYGQRSAFTPLVSAFIDPALNVDPIVNVKFWPSVLPSSGKGIVRVLGRDPDGQTLSLVANATGGTLTATDDPSVWTITVP